MSESVLALGAQDFEEKVLKAALPVLVDFWAEWCGPCKALAPHLEDIAQRYAGRLQVAKLNIDEHTEIAQQYGIRSIPTLILFKDGKEAARQIGTPQEGLAAFIDGHLQEA